MEVTLRSECALKAIEEISKKVCASSPSTLRTLADVTNAKLAGSKFAVSPGYTSEMGEACSKINLPLLPGVSTGSEVMKANGDGFYFLKLFPAIAVGGINLLKGFAGPFADISFCPTGGITLKPLKIF